MLFYVVESTLDHFTVTQEATGSSAVAPANFEAVPWDTTFLDVLVALRLSAALQPITAAFIAAVHNILPLRRHEVAEKSCPALPEHLLCALFQLIRYPA